MIQRILVNFQLAIEGVATNKMRGFLTALGIVFGVAAVIAMLAIGTGAKQSILDQMRLIGTNNIVVKAGNDDKEEQSEESTQNASGPSNSNKKPWSPGLSLKDLEAIRSVVPGIESVSPEIVINASAIYKGKIKKLKCVGVENPYFQINNLSLAEGMKFHDLHHLNGDGVCIIGKNVQQYFFAGENPIGQLIKCGQVWLRVIGVLQSRTASDESLKNLGIRDLNDDIYIPLKTALIRFEDRGFIRSKHVGRTRQVEDRNYHQIDRAVFQMGESENLRASAEVFARILKRRHNDQLDFEIEVPELLLQQQQKTQETFNFVLAVIAGISLLVGGIGIMNIMLASVLERIKEIGVRRSMGAYRIDIIYQFLFEAIIISMIGGLTGIILGVSAASIISRSADIPTIISMWSILLAFGVAASIGLIFGLFPARRAARLDPINALRTD